MNEKYVEITIFDIFRAIKRKKTIFIMFFLVILFLTIIVIYFLPEKYETYAILEYNGKVSSQQSILENIGFSNLLNLSDNTSNLETELGKLKLDSVIFKVIKKMDLTNLANQNKTLYQKLRNITITDIDMMRSLQKKINIENYGSAGEDKTSNLIKVSFLGSNPTFAASLISNLYESYYNYSEKQYYERMQVILKNIEDLLLESENKSKYFFNKLIDFEKENLISDNNKLNILFDKYYTLEMELLDFENKTVLLQEQIKTIENRYYNIKKEYKIKLLLNNPTFSTIENGIIKNRLEYETLKLTSPNDPKIFQLESKIKTEEEFLKTKIKETLKDNIIFMLSTNPQDFYTYTSLKYELENLSLEKEVSIKLKEKVKLLIGEKSDLLKQYLDIKKNYEEWNNKEKIFKQYLDQEKIKKLIYEPKLKMIDKIYIPTSPVFPNKKLFLGIGLFFAFIISFIMAFIFDLKDNRVKDIELFTKFIKLPEYIIDNENNIQNISKKILSHIISSSYRNIGISKVGNIDFDLINELEKELLIFENSKVNIFKVKSPKDMKLLEYNDIEKINIIELPSINDGYFDLFFNKVDSIILIVEEFSSNIKDIKYFLYRNNLKNIKILYIK
ncbi:Uncharacterized protein involved in exopolysaccharide biosynthesis [Marinitoga hydrogenitolerans DSM 16785]|uniref:Uncharacterized protein involved in exopolysaccharide biosynthesis n=1 Tax=Marinitoga hydrogenitolerans (strain DSM 16785 / JCM 12826 / AT1271) TaxID=1122195 RepID=A0A1M4Y480_MARH1|nr:Wzz/FepE/Etk N-terminal domain-containing protein [Marinitoga hydrogenitolerans]SHF00607.1 Uncharacterized protein involved in exopolysaccharide biosynthesis [Marinitoga hydrogenitolerans DSM 16785]